jgi:hypothetical protein
VVADSVLMDLPLRCRDGYVSLPMTPRDEKM